MKIKVFNTSWNDGRKNFRLEVDGELVLDVLNYDKDNHVASTFHFCSKIPQLLEDVYHQGQKDGMKGSVETKTTNMEYNFGQ